MNQISPGEAEPGRRLRVTGAELDDEAAMQPGQLRGIELLTVRVTDPRRRKITARTTVRIRREGSFFMIGDHLQHWGREASECGVDQQRIVTDQVTDQPAHSRPACTNPSASRSCPLRP